MFKNKAVGVITALCPWRSDAPANNAPSELNLIIVHEQKRQMKARTNRYQFGEAKEQLLKSGLLDDNVHNVRLLSG
jgi:hypothetical protein